LKKSTKSVAQKMMLFLQILRLKNWCLGQVDWLLVELEPFLQEEQHKEFQPHPHEQLGRRLKGVLVAGLALLAFLVGFKSPDVLGRLHCAPD
jgi:hypothetical protein